MTFLPPDPEVTHRIRERLAEMRAERSQRAVEGCQRCKALLTGPPPTEQERRDAAKRLGLELGD